MKTVNFIINRTILFLSILLSSLLSENVLALYWEISDTSLPYIARVRADPNWGAAVLYNPDTCREIDAACGFFKEHAYAHAHLNHMLLPPEAYSPISEAQADCWVAKNGNPKEVYAAVELLLDDNRNPNLNIIGDPAKRAEEIRACAKVAENWIGD